MNIPPENQPNDLNREPGEANVYIRAIQTFANQVYDANREWNDVKDFAVRLAVPLFGMAATAMFRHYLEKRNVLIAEEDAKLQQDRAKLRAEKEIFEAERGAFTDRPVARIVDDLMAQGNTRSYKALKEIDELEPLIKDVINIRHSLFTSRSNRYPIEKEIRARLLKQPSPLDSCGTLKAQILEDTIDMFKKDAIHRGDLYNLYADNWRLRVDLEKHKQVIERLKHSSAEKRQA